ncbi:serine hydrolase domain-containing protein [Nocardia mangyaensis]|uniref:serine hydrolase domain-containing protein n=1 Tax=Nocardia mangyaensis TaxID=2213200 RepID=UPI002677354D|nr:serine hydrolase domain-containing protein [Nocardia mangyaensis]MDO3650031.1 serine hydrolase domain-containing protein [Nocardia mangyaensis]
MSNDAYGQDTAALPAGVGGFAPAGFGPLARAFAALIGHRRDAGGALAIYRHGEPLAHLWTGSAGEKPWTAETGAIVFSATKGVTATVIHRLADRGLIDYRAPVAEYWPRFAAHGKGAITVADVLTHRSGLSSLSAVATTAAESLDHELMEDRLAMARPDGLLGVPAYHALTYGWLLAGLARAVTGRDMGELIRAEVTDPLGIDGIHLGRPAAGSATEYARLSGAHLSVVAHPIAAGFLGRIGYRIPGPLGAAARCLFVPGLGGILDGDDPAILNSQMPAGNGVATAAGLARMYAALADGVTLDGQPFLQPGTHRAIRRVQTYRPDHALFYLPMMWHLGYHSMPAVGARNAFGHIGLGGSFGWVDPQSGLSVGFVHNRLDQSLLAYDQIAMGWLLPLVLSGVRAGRGRGTRIDRAAAA